jgi:hypothetical protein
METQDQPQGLKYYTILLSESEKDLLKNVLNYRFDEIKEKLEEELTADDLLGYETLKKEIKAFLIKLGN